MFKKIKELLKAEALELRAFKAHTKEAQRTKKPEFTTWPEYHKCWLAQPSRLHYKKKEYRHMHIAYCMLRGRTYEQIEPKVREGNPVNADLLNRYLARFKKMLEVKDVA